MGKRIGRNTPFMVVVPWVHKAELEAFREAWRIPDLGYEWLLFQHDADREGCAVTKNRGVARAVVRGADVVVILDGDCYPRDAFVTLEDFALQHVAALQPQPIQMFEQVTVPPSRGTPYSTFDMAMPVAASMGFWAEIGDYCAVRQLAHDAQRMSFRHKPVFGRYFPLCGMNLAFRPADWSPWCDFIDVLRFDDIWMGWLWQKEAYRRGFCFNLNGPLVRHARQSNVWKNLQQEAVHLERNETLWREIAEHHSNDYAALRALLPV